MFATNKRTMFKQCSVWPPLVRIISEILLSHWSIALCIKSWLIFSKWHLAPMKCLKMQSFFTMCWTELMWYSSTSSNFAPTLAGSWCPCLQMSFSMTWMFSCVHAEWGRPLPEERLDEPVLSIFLIRSFNVLSFRFLDRNLASFGKHSNHFPPLSILSNSCLLPLMVPCLL